MGTLAGSHLGFEKLKRHIEEQYEAKGIPKEKAQEWATKTAGKVANEKKAEGGDKG